MSGNSKNKRKSAGIRTTLISKTPVLIRYTEDENRVLKLQPYLCLERFKTREAVTKDWTTLSFRLTVGVKLAALFFNEEAATLLIKATNIICDVKDRYTRMNHRWGMSDSEIELVREGLELTDGMQDNTTRKEQLKVYLEVQKLFK